ncbi:CheY-like superfamily [Penicillium cf. griseofulvum]|uniref:histidine kinase n=1 Tax=Penicillium cf. griseofulvum TaxID=2972120 RepID=A0A9W9M1B0_9EURO|nr:CheY-like superfamily [Penicillium cf. griseofulvum]KAJ5429222.1 CheY-like superfamily [Penicillium cf. griseofulvum]KAJ5436986.1 CheY-like superfamily [Penicillium cf. griseofulvum]
MNSAGVSAFHTPEEDPERQRIRDLSRYYCTVVQAFPAPDATNSEEQETPAAPTGDEQPTGCELAKDITLNALAQLGVLRFNANRCFVSIIDGETQHIIAETTGSVSLRDKNHHKPGDGIYLGARSLDLVWGVCPHTVRLFTGRATEDIDTSNVTANRTRYIIRDFTLEDCFKDRPYVRDWPHMRFYAEVPLFSASGYVLGSYCIVDNKPWTDFGDDQVNDLQEVADAIGLHLENVRMRQAHIRTEKLVKGLTNFVKDHVDFDPEEASNHGRLQSSVNAANLVPHEIAATTADAGDDSDITPVLDAPLCPAVQCVSHKSGQSISSTVAGEESMFFLQDQGTTTEPSSLYSGFSDRPLVLSPGEEKSMGEALKSGETAASQAIDQSFSQLSLTESKPIYERISSIYSRASVLLRDSMDLDGVAFLDACPTNFAFVPEQPETYEPLAAADPSFPAAPLPSPLGMPRAASPEFDLPCDTLSCALKLPSKGDNSGPNNEPSIPQGLLHQMLKAFPQGQILSLDETIEEGDYLSTDHTSTFDSRLDHSTHTCAKHLAECLPGAKSALFLPLWDWNKSRWLSGVLVWTTSSFRALGLEELHYFKVFGDSLISEVSRIHWASTERSKFDFISSVSHELRSPLHGILASAELLHATTLSRSQEEMVTMIEKSGLTLLDTTNHMLEFCKVNNLRNTNTLNEITSGNDTANLVSDFNISHLVEEVADILYTGQRAPEQVSQLAKRMSSNKEATDSITKDSSTQNQMSIVIRVDQMDNWMIRSFPGAWRRIVMNLLGNAMKWTTAGFIEIALSKARDRSDSQSPLVRLSVTDTGRGIAPDFIKHKLFAPFSQEDPLSEGVGLGLSTVQQLVMSLGGHVNVRSELGVGTQADVYIPVQYLPANLGPEDSLASSTTQPGTAPMHACLVGFNGYPDLTEAPTGILTVEGKRNLSIQSALANIFMTKMKWNISFANSIEEAHGQVIVIEQELLRRAMDENNQRVSELAAQNGIDFFVVLSGNVPIILDSLSVNVIRVAQPFGPQKIYNAVETIMRWREIQIPTASPTPDTASWLMSPQIQSENSSDSGSGSDIHEKGISEHSSELMSSCKGLNTTTPRPPSNQALAHVLIVDDNEINVKIMATFMRKINCSYDTAHNGLVALEKYKSSNFHYDFILMDISMPVMDGLVSTSKIREFEREHRLNPSCIMAVTGVSSTGFQDQAATAGINNYLIKPLSLRALRTLMNIT